ncbi:hypothetical protein COEREDRAFT_94682 [Coemansia reversa NRRL 1564]|uniref:C2H2-type domain-containing protein n=1 Tax=Coemansia reversa (strain ATCC 12441 / NRRL 1564) TaxID=763665 RepID=A0A2G5B2N7_COERN|nr:hypothetical protein COEREDRAFT_94682 [Coemansia reversa NRRL 1564]|eukprot:PIA13278.1 hypothetical protein COEREDRAFT_94682 [Coemansia reversa NRRL 1564]
MSLYSCKSCGVYFDSKVWYEGHLRRAHGKPAKVEISTVPTFQPDEYNVSSTARRPRLWPRYIKRIFSKTAKA